MLQSTSLGACFYRVFTGLGDLVTALVPIPESTFGRLRGCVLRVFPGRGRILGLEQVRVT